ncbi:hypothetical protein [Streptomyces sp. CC228A]|uniref:hypothetical protein n=1 Tax=Streptomyces sp. CC228A TaxID=2898186 RepID=UPI001F46A130|nr:hypothetical protein [Streptomyces sp. CC228A]
MTRMVRALSAIAVAAAAVLGVAAASGDPAWDAAPTSGVAAGDPSWDSSPAGQRDPSWDFAASPLQDPAWDSVGARTTGVAA